VLNDELMLLPGGLSRILGITTHLEIPVTIPAMVLHAGLALAIAGATALLLVKRKSNN
jgi:hypothetical protein